MRSLAVITARGGSKRIPRKNIREFNGRPIIAYSIEAALNSGVFDEVMVSTEDKEIAEISRKYGADIPFLRSDKTADDHATTTDVLIEVINEYKKKGYEFDVIACIYPTAPLISSQRLNESIDIINRSDADSVVPVVRFSFPPQRAVKIENGCLAYVQPEYVDYRSQDLDPFYHDAGQFYVFKTKSFMKNRRIIAGKVIPMELSEMEVQDIDNMMDWKLAELKYNLLYNKS